MVILSIIFFVEIKYINTYKISRIFAADIKPACALECFVSVGGWVGGGDKDS